MTDFDQKEVALFGLCIRSLTEEFDSNVTRPVRMTLDVSPVAVTNFALRLSNLQSALQGPIGKNSPRDEDLPLLKSALLRQLRAISEGISSRRRLTPDGGTKELVDAGIKPYEDLAGQPWFSEVEAEVPPVLTDYLVMSKIQEWFSHETTLAPREFDEKFGILTAPGLFLTDLAHYRTQCCDLRRLSVSVGYLDIDDFKAYNDHMTEPRVDREVLPRFMRVVEAKVFGQGHAYRMGGDEYVVLLPNRTGEEAVRFFQGLQDALSAADYGETANRPTVSIGVCEVTPGSILTDRQVEERAAAAKKVAKDEGKNRVTLLPPT